jgi:hypothetical protein
MTRLRLAVALALSVLIPGATSDAQAWAYPSFQPPRLTPREYNFGLANSDNGGTSLVFQWREQAGPVSQFSFDVGIADPEGRESDIVAFGGVGFARRLGSPTDDVPIEFLWTVGAYLAIGNDFFFRVPLGLSLGHRFDLDGMALTPYLHPRLSLDFCDDCGGTDLGITFDLGANFEVSRTVAIRAAAFFSGSDSFDGDGFGISLAWTPAALSRRR